MGSGTDLYLRERQIKQEQGPELPVEGKPGGRQCRCQKTEKRDTNQETNGPSEFSAAVNAPMTAQYMQMTSSSPGAGARERALKVE